VEGFALDITEDGSAPVSLLLALETARASGLAPERILLRSAGQVALPDTQRWSAALGIPVERGAPWRWMEARQRPKIDLLQGEFASRGSASGWQRRLRRPAILAGALLVIGSCGIAADWEAKAHERNRLLAEMRAIYRETFGESAAVVDPPLQMSRALAELRLRAGQGGPADFLALLAPLADRLLDPARQRIDSISYENGTLAVSLQPAEQMPPGKLAEELRAKASIQGLSIRTEDVGSGGKAALRLTATAGR
jgi:type II secretion system protein L